MLHLTFQLLAHVVSGPDVLTGDFSTRATGRLCWWTSEPAAGRRPAAASPTTPPRSDESHQRQPPLPSVQCREEVTAQAVRCD